MSSFEKKWWATLQDIDIPQITEQLFACCSPFFRVADERRTKFFNGPGREWASPDLFECDPENYETEFYLYFPESAAGEPLGPSRCKLAANLYGKCIGSEGHMIRNCLHSILNKLGITSNDTVSFDFDESDWILNTLEDIQRYNGPFSCILYKELLRFCFPLDGNWQRLKWENAARRVAQSLARKIDDLYSTDWVVLTAIERVFEQFPLTSDFEHFKILNPCAGHHPKGASHAEQLEVALNETFGPAVSLPPQNRQRFDETVATIAIESDSYIPNRPQLAISAGKGVPDFLEDDMRSLVALHSAALRLCQFHYENCHHHPEITADFDLLDAEDFYEDQTEGSRENVVAFRGAKLPNGTPIRSRLVEMVSIAVAITPRTGGCFGPINLVSQVRARRSPYWWEDPDFPM